MKVGLLFLAASLVGVSGFNYAGISSASNVARGKPTKQSSTTHGGVPQRAVDGSRNAFWSGASCTHTTYQERPWWRVDLGSTHKVFSVSLTNRKDCCSNRLREIEIKVTNYDNPYDNEGRLCAYQKSALGPGETKALKCIQPIAGRYVFVMLKVKEPLTLCEVEVLGVVGKKPSFPGISSATNAARGQPTKQSSTSHGGVPQRAVDGSRNPFWSGASCTHTSQQDRPWWRVDLGSRHKVFSVSLTNREDCCSNRLREIEVKVTNYDDPHDNEGSLCAYHRGALGAGETKALQCDKPTTGRFVFVKLKVKESLTLCEVEVFAVAAQKPSFPGISFVSNIARGKPTKQSSTGHGGVPQRAVDGSRNAFWSGASCTHTNYQERPWWRVDLGSRHKIFSVSLTNREDCCSNRLREIEIKVTNYDNLYDNQGSLCAYHKDAFGPGQTKALECNQPTPGRYVFVSLRIKEYLTLCEVQVFGVQAMRLSFPGISSAANAARGKPTKQSSTGHGGVPQRAVDGSRNPFWSGASCTHTNQQDRPWWRVDLGSRHKVFSVALTNRKDCCSNRLREIEVKVTNYDNPYDTEGSLCAYHKGPFGSGERKALKCIQPIAGRYVFVMLKVKEHLTLCEVEVFAVAARNPSFSNAALGKPTKQCSTSYGGLPQRAVDGIKNPNWSGASCTHTGYQEEPWWRVDLGSLYNIFSVALTNRKDCCSNRLREIEIKVTNSDDPDDNKGSLCTYHRNAFGPGETKELECIQPETGRYVFVMLKVKEFLTLCEVKVFADRALS